MSDKKSEEAPPALRGMRQVEKLVPQPLPDDRPAPPPAPPPADPAE